VRWLSDEAVDHLRAVAELPDFGGTRYRIIREIGRGGMGVIYEAEEPELERRVAVKVLATELVSRHAAERMREEARVVARLEHPGIVPLHDVGTLADGRVFYAMKLVRGRRLDQVSAGEHELLRIFLRVCEAVGFAHANGVVHRDLKPENIMVGEFGEVLVMDWGVATSSIHSEPERLIAGTRGYMAPEQERGEPVNSSTDVFALGAILRGLLGDRPSRLLGAVCAKACAPVPAGRYNDANELAADVVRFLDGERLIAYRENVVERLSRWLDRNRALVAVVIAYLVMRTIVALWARH
jgi:serine/threonine protein kinase